MKTTYNKELKYHIIEINRNEIEKIDFVTCAEPRETLKNFYDRQNKKPNLITNGGFFGMLNGIPVFNYIDEGEIKSFNNNYQWGIGITKEGKLDYGCCTTKDKWKDFVCGYPVLLDKKEKQPLNYANEINYKARRTLLGYNNEKVFIVLIENPGQKLDFCQDLMLKLDCDYAINLDGGGSSKALIEGECITKDIGNRPVDNVVCIYLKEKKEYLYKVQVGAFRTKENADRLCQELKNKGYPSFVVKTEK